VELLVAFIQAYVFTLLSAVFIGLARVRNREENKNNGPEAIHINK
jgi:F-type H+-transporting ATPase subunit a